MKYIMLSKRKKQGVFTIMKYILSSIIPKSKASFE